MSRFFKKSFRHRSPFARRIHRQKSSIQGLAIGVVAMFGIAVVGAGILGGAVAGHQKLAKAQITTAVSEILEYKQETILDIRTKAFDELDIQAQNILVTDLVTGEVWFERDSYSPVPLASVAKLATTYVAHKGITNEIITISNSAISQLGDFGLSVGQKVSRDDLIRMALVVSSNDAAYALGEAYEQNTNISIVDALNWFAGDNGWETLHFNNPTGLDITADNGDDISGATGSAKDITELLTLVATENIDVFETSTDVAVAELATLLESRANNTNKIRSSLSGLRISKTGFTDLAGGNLVFVFEPEIARPFAVVILGSGYDERFDDAEKIVNTIYENL
ncbi:MAG: serine hydrolase [Candidatus Nomurabacteria bacterium]|nr:serine hydrolase [Candidatus Nomurabacteria bacterium]